MLTLPNGFCWRNEPAMTILKKTPDPKKYAKLAAGFALIVLTCCSRQESESGVKMPIPPLKGLEAVSPQNLKFKGGFWGARLETHRKTTIPHVLDHLENSHHFSNFDLAAKVVRGEASGSSDRAGEARDPLQGDSGGKEISADPETENTIVGNHAFDSDAHKGLEGACHLLGLEQDPALLKKVNGFLDCIIAAQQEDGYLNSYYTAKEPENRWRNLRLNHEMYVAGHFMELAVAHHQLTASNKALDAAKRLADHIDATFGPGKRYDVGGHQEIELALIKLYRMTGEKRYLELSRFLLDERGHAHGTERKPFTDVPPRTVPQKKPDETMREFRQRKWSTRNGRMQDHKPLLEQNEAVGHAVRAGYTYSAMADIARFSDAPEYAEAVRILWEDVVFRKMYLTGGLGTAQYGDEGFGDPYLLPNKTYCESCAGMAHVFWQHRMNLMDGHSKYVDVMELTLYNAAICGLALEGDSFFYRNPLESRSGARRVPWIGLACCPTNFARFIPQIGGYVYATNGEDIFVNLYASSESNLVVKDDLNLTIQQETNFPWDGQVSLIVAPERAAKFCLHLRIPKWALGRPVPGDLYRFADPGGAVVTLTVNGQSLEVKPGMNGYVSLNRTWSHGDTVELDLPMPVRRVHAHEKIEANQGKVAFMRGPVVYCFEGMDHPGVNLFKVSIPADSKCVAKHRPDLLDGVSVIRTTGIDEQGNPVQLTAIPYYAWSNRDKGAMTVWIRESGTSSGQLAQ